MTTNQYQIPLHLLNHTCWLDCAPEALSQLAMERLGGKSFDPTTLAQFLVQNPNWLLLAITEIASTGKLKQKLKLIDIKNWLVSTDLLTELRVKPETKKAGSKKSVLRKSKTDLKAAQAINKRLVLIESGDDLKATLVRLVDKPFRKSLLESLETLRIAKSCWKAIRQSARSWTRELSRESSQPQLDQRSQPDYRAVFSTLNALETTQADFDDQLLIQKLDSMRLLAYGASHEINNPLANIATRAQALLTDEHDLKRKQRLTVIYEQAMRAHEMISDMMLFAHPPKINPTRVELKEIISDVVGELSTKLAAAKIVCKTTAKSQRPAVMSIDPTQIAVAIKAILVNSIEAIGSDGQIDIEITSKKRGTTIRISDNGPGIDDSISDNIFDPFFSGREAGRGLGFGLSKAWRIFQLHNATLRRQESESGGAMFDIFIPSKQNCLNDCVDVKDENRSESVTVYTAQTKRVA